MNKYENALMTLFCKAHNNDEVCEANKYTKDESCLECNVQKAFEKLQELVEKATPKKPIEYEDKYYGCPCCENNLLPKWLEYPTKPMPKSCGFPHCMSCGQTLDWSEEE